MKLIIKPHSVVFQGNCCDLEKVKDVLKDAADAVHCHDDKCCEGCCDASS